MRRPLMAALLLGVTLAGCATVRDSRINPFNWFDRSERAEAVANAPAAPGTAFVQVAEVTSLTVEPTNSGAIVKATGLPPTQGWWDGDLIPEPSDDPSALVFRFVLKAPPDVAQRRISTPQSREVTVATQLSRHKLQGVSRITVTGAGNARTTARR